MAVINETRFRNRVLHRGVIPTIDDTFRFGEYCMNYIRGIQKFISKKYDMEIFRYTSVKTKKYEHLFSEEKVKQGGINIYNPMEWILDVNYALDKKSENDFTYELERLKKIKQIIDMDL